MYGYIISKSAANKSQEPLSKMRIKNICLEILEHFNINQMWIEKNWLMKDERSKNGLYIKKELRRAKELFNDVIL